MKRNFLRKESPIQPLRPGPTLCCFEVLWQLRGALPRFGFGLFFPVFTMKEALLFGALEAELKRYPTVSPPKPYQIVACTRAALWHPAVWFAAGSGSPTCFAFLAGCVFW